MKVRCKQSFMWTAALCAAAFGSLPSGEAFGQITAPGDLQFIGLQADAPDGFAFVTWVDLPNGQTVTFTDNGWQADDAFRTTENTLFWENNTGSTIVAGTVVAFSDGTGFNLGTTVSGSMSGVSNDGEQIFAFLGTLATPTLLIHGLDLNGAAGWDADAADSNTSALPTALDVPGGNLAFAHFDNAHYTGPRTGLSIDDYKAALADSSNWTFNNSAVVISTTAFAITAVPEPSTWAMLTLLAFGGLCAARRKPQSAVLATTA